jgi:hypothetical protein
LFEGLSGVIPECERQGRGGGDNARQPDNGDDTDEYVDDLGGRGPRVDCRVGQGAVGRDRAADRDQRR